MMESLSHSNSLNLCESEQSFFIHSGQDGLFFSLEFLQNYLKTDDVADTPEITAYFQDGACILKDQTILKIRLKNNKFKKKDLISMVSYLSGVYTLISCWTERNFDFSIMASSTPDFALSEWEEKAILKAGAQIGQFPEDICFDSKSVRQELDKGSKHITLSNMKMPEEKIKEILQSIPSHVKCSLHGSFFPSDLEGLRSLHLHSVYPLCLQGFFPQLKMTLDTVI